MAADQNRLQLRQDKERLDQEIADKEADIKQVTSKLDQEQDATKAQRLEQQYKDLVDRVNRLIDQRQELQRALAGGAGAAREVSMHVDKTAKFMTDEGWGLDISLRDGKLPVQQLKEVLAGQKRILKAINGKVVGMDKDGWSTDTFNDTDIIMVATELKPGVKTAKTAIAYAAAEQEKEQRLQWWLRHGLRIQ